MIIKKVNMSDQLITLIRAQVADFVNTFIIKHKKETIFFRKNFTPNSANTFKILNLLNKISDQNFKFKCILANAYYS